MDLARSFGSKLLGPTAVKVLLPSPVVCEIDELAMMDGLGKNLTHVVLEFKPPSQTLLFDTPNTPQLWVWTLKWEQALAINLSFGSAVSVGFQG